MQDLIRGIKKIVRASETKKTVSVESDKIEVSYKEKRRRFKAGLCKGFGIGFLSFAFLGFLGSMDDGIDGTDIGMIIFFAAIGIALFFASHRIKKEVERVNNYLSVIVNGGERRLHDIADATGKQYDTVKKDIQKMIDKKILKNAYINEGTREIVFTNSQIK